MTTSARPGWLALPLLVAAFAGPSCFTIGLLQSGTTTRVTRAVVATDERAVRDRDGVAGFAVYLRDPGSIVAALPPRTEGEHWLLARASDGEGLAMALGWAKQAPHTSELALALDGDVPENAAATLVLTALPDSTPPGTFTLPRGMHPENGCLVLRVPCNVAWIAAPPSDAVAVGVPARVTASESVRRGLSVPVKVLVTPATVALDVVTSPLQLLALPFLASVSNRPPPP